MGVSGSGKTTLGKALTQKLGWDFFDANAFYSPANIAKMASGIPLSDSDCAHGLLLCTINIIDKIVAKYFS